MEYVYYDNIQNQFQVDINLSHVFENFVKYNCTYHYKAIIEVIGIDGNFEIKNQILHCHSFEDVINAVYMYPVSFEIPEEYLNEYSEQELKFLDKIKRFLISIDLKDIKRSKEEIILDKKIYKLYSKPRTLINSIKLEKLYKEYDVCRYNRKIKRCSNNLLNKYFDK